MKNLKKASLLFVVLVSAVCVSCVNLLFNHIKGNGDLITLEITVPQFEKINIGGSAEVRFHASQEHRVVLTTDSNLFGYVDIFTRNNMLNIGTKNRYSLSFTKWLVDIYSPSLTGVLISGSGSFKSRDEIIASKFESNVSGSGKIEAAIECETFLAAISGSGRIAVAGKSGVSNINISGSGRFNGADFCVNSATVRISGSGNADICVSDNLNANISGSGSINYRGNPQINSSISGTGRIKRL